MREDETTPADQVDAFKSGAPVGGSKMPARGGFPDVDLFEKGGDVANLVGSSFTGKGWSGLRYCEETPSRASP